jgi:hypothetical protein
MKLITTINRPQLLRKTPASARPFGGRKSLLSELRTAQIGRAELEKYEAAVQIYRDGGCRLREIERAAISRLERAEPVPAPMQPLQPGEVDSPAIARGVFRSSSPTDVLSGGVPAADQLERLNVPASR